MAHIHIVDMPCGYGKSSRIVSSFDKREKYIAVVPYLSEVKRFISDAQEKSKMILTEPVSGSSNKSDHCEKLLRAGKSIATTHAMFYRLGTLATLSTGAARCVAFEPGTVPSVEVEHLLDGYNLIIDEVINPFELDQTVRSVDFDQDYLDMGLAEVHADGRVVPTPAWDLKYFQGSKTFSPALYDTNGLIV